MELIRTVKVDTYNEIEYSYYIEIGNGNEKQLFKIVLYGICGSSIIIITTI